MFRPMIGAILTLLLACSMGISIAAFTTTPAAAMKSGQAVLACAGNLKCHDEMTDKGEHVMCVKGGGCVLCPADPQGTCDVALRAHEVAVTTDPAEVLKGETPPSTVTPTHWWWDDTSTPDHKDAPAAPAAPPAPRPPRYLH